MFPRGEGWGSDVQRKPLDIIQGENRTGCGPACEATWPRTVALPEPQPHLRLPCVAHLPGVAFLARQGLWKRQPLSPLTGELTVELFRTKPSRACRGGTRVGTTASHPGGLQIRCAHLSKEIFLRFSSAFRQAWYRSLIATTVATTAIRASHGATRFARSPASRYGYAFHGKGEREAESSCDVLRVTHKESFTDRDWSCLSDPRDRLHLFSK